MAQHIVPATSTRPTTPTPPTSQTSQTSPTSPTSPAPYSPESFIPVPTRRTRALRTLFPWQLYRFLVLNIRMLRMIAKSHD